MQLFNRKFSNYPVLYIFILLLLSLAANGCRKTPNEEECTESHINKVKLLANIKICADSTDPGAAKDSSDEGYCMPEEVQRLMMRNILGPKFRDSLIKSCLSMKSLPQVKCEMEAKKFSDLNACKKLGKISENPGTEPVKTETK